MVRLRAAGLCVLPLKGILNICTKCSEWDIKFSLYNERASAVEVATNSEKMSRCTVKLVNTAQDTLKMVYTKDLFDSCMPAGKTDEVLKSTQSCIIYLIEYLAT